jgi:prepilin-type N-terminal cleavage/methylation domain-containing protein
LVGSFGKVNEKFFKEKTMVKSMKRKAFTLIELLVVISIIALLLSILMPGLQKAKQHAQRMICKTNLHNYGIAGNLYLMENNERFPDPWQSMYDSCQGRCSGTCTSAAHQTFPGEAQRYCRWHNADFSLAGHPEYQGPLWSYLESEEVNLCPIFKKVAKQRGPEHTRHVASIPIDPQFGYSQNAYLGTDYFGGERKMSGVRSPARTFYFAEENMWTINQSTGYRVNLSSAVLNDTALLARTDVGDPGNFEDCFATFHSPPGGDFNEGTGNWSMGNRWGETFSK